MTLRNHTRKHWRTYLSGCLMAGALATTGCSGGKSAFRRFWGFEQTSPHQAQFPASANTGGLVTKLFNQEAEFTGDPFLNQDFGHEIQTAELDQQPAVKPTEANEKVELALFDEPPAQGGEVIPATSVETPMDGNPFRMVQHQQPVQDISSAESTAASDPLDPQTKQMHRLKSALKQDAIPQTPIKPDAGLEELAKQRVETIMRNARRQMQLGEYESALRWATAAEQMASRAKLFFGPDEDPPADLVRTLQDRLQIASLEKTPEVNAIVEEALPEPMPFEPFPETPAEVVESVPPQTEPVAIPEELTTPTVPHSTHAMKEAVIAPETTKPAELPAEETPIAIVPQQRHSRSLKVDARRVSANQGAVVTVEGQMNPPVESIVPSVPLAPPAQEDAENLPVMEVALFTPEPSTEVPPPLPPPTAVAPEPQVAAAAPSGSQFLYAPEEPRESGSVKNVRWNDDAPEADSPAWKQWGLTVGGLLSGLLIGWVFLGRKR